MFFFFFFNDTATTEIYTLSLHDALPISLYLLIVVVRFLTVFVWWQLEFASFFDAVRFALWLKSRVPIYYFSLGRLLEGTAVTFYEALMPAFQVIVLLGMASPARAAGRGSR